MLHSVRAVGFTSALEYDVSALFSARIHCFSIIQRARVHCFSIIQRDIEYIISACRGSVQATATAGLPATLSLCSISTVCMLFASSETHGHSNTRPIFIQTQSRYFSSEKMVNGPFDRMPGMILKPIMRIGPTLTL